MTMGRWALQGAVILPICPLPDAEVTHRSFSSVSMEDRTKHCFESSALLRSCLPRAMRRGGWWRTGMGRASRSRLHKDQVRAEKPLWCAEARRQEEWMKGRAVTCSPKPHAWLSSLCSCLLTAQGFLQARVLFYASCWQQAGWLASKL